MKGDARAARRLGLALALGLGSWLAGCAGLHGSAPAPASERSGTGGFSFAVIGDMPYAAREVAAVDALLAQIDADPEIAFVLHVGDLKGGSEPCDDTLLQARTRQLQALKKPWIYTPGDNEWTDCHRAAAGRFVPLERLQALRRLFFAQPTRSGGATPLTLESQASMPGHEAFVENARFAFQRVHVATLHVVGSRNDLEPWAGLDASDSAQQPRPDRLAAFQARERANLAWLDRVFDRATQEGAPALVLAFQANPGMEARPGATARIGFEPVLQRLRERSAAFARPVLVLHGDFHTLIVDQPWRAAEGAAPAVPGLTRVQTYGSPLLQWLKLRVDPSGVQPFQVEPGGVPKAR